MSTHSETLTRTDGKATVWSHDGTSWHGFMVLPVEHAVVVALAHRDQGRRVRVTF